MREMLGEFLLYDPSHWVQACVKGKKIYISYRPTNNSKVNLERTRFDIEIENGF